RFRESVGGLVVLVLGVLVLLLRVPVVEGLVVRGAAWILVVEAFFVDRGDARLVRGRRDLVGGRAERRGLHRRHGRGAKERHVGDHAAVLLRSRLRRGEGNVARDGVGRCDA